MVEITDAEVQEIDVAVVAYRDEGTWHLAELPDEALGSVESIGQELRRYPDRDGALALISVAEDFSLLVRSRGAGAGMRVLLSDASAATDWHLARSATDHLGLEVEEDDEDEVGPVGDLAIVSDLGVDAAEMGELLDDDELFPDEVLSEVADAAGFGPRFDLLAGLED